jgi:competence protein ComEC
VVYIGAVCVGVTIGIMSARWLDVSWLRGGWWMGLAALVVVGLVRRGGWVALGITLFIACIVGYAHGNDTMATWRQTQQLIGRAVVVSGVVAEDVEQSRRGDLVVRLTQLRSHDRAMGGTLWVTVSAGRENQAIKRGDEVSVSGKMTDGFGTYVATLYRAKVQQVRAASQNDVMLSVRDWFSAQLQQVFSAAQSALAAGFVLGQKRALDPQLDEALRIVGLTHVVVASGYNLTVLVRAARRIGMRLSRFAAFFLAAGLMIGFIAIAGASASMVRAGIVAGLSLVVWYYGRVVHPVVLLLCGAAVSAWYQPAFTWGDIGWLLSFTSFAGVMLLAPVLQQYFYGSAKPGFIRQVIGETISAQIATTPIIVMVFGSFSVIALAANVLIVPLVPLAMLGSVLAGLVHVLLPQAAVVFSLPTSWLLGYMLSVIEYFSRLSWASVGVHIPLIGCVVMYVVMYVVIIMLTWYMKRASGYSYRTSNLVE